MVVEAMIRRVPRGGTRSVRGLAKQLLYLSRQSDPDRDNINLVGAQRHQFDQVGAPPANLNPALNPNNAWEFARALYRRSGQLAGQNLTASLNHDLTMHFVISFPPGTDPAAAERAGRDWAEYVFGHGFRNEQGHVGRHDYVTAFHSHGAENNHPHMHVIVDRAPLGGGHLLRLEEGHPHWSYEAMRLQAVEAAANHGIALIAVAGLQVDMQRPIELQETERRRLAARRVPYYDPNFDQEQDAPGTDDPSDDVHTRESIDLSCEPVLVDEPDADFDIGAGPGDDQDDDDSDDDQDDGSDGGSGGSTARPRRSRTPESENGSLWSLSPSSEDFSELDYDAGKGSSTDRQMQIDRNVFRDQQTDAGSPYDSGDLSPGNMEVDSEESGPSEGSPQEALRRQKIREGKRRAEEYDPSDMSPQYRSDQGNLLVDADRQSHVQRRQHLSDREGSLQNENNMRGKRRRVSGSIAEPEEHGRETRHSVGNSTQIDLDSPKRSREQRLEAARNKLKRVRARKRKHRESPQPTTVAGKRAWRAELNDHTQRVREAQIALTIELYGRSNITTRSMTRRAFPAARQTQTAANGQPVPIMAQGQEVAQNHPTVAGDQNSDQSNATQIRSVRERASPGSSRS